MYGQGRVKCTKKPLSSLLERGSFCTFDERSDSGKPLVFRSSARGLSLYNIMNITVKVYLHIEQTTPTYIYTYSVTHKTEYKIKCIQLYTKLKKEETQQ